MNGDCLGFLSASQVWQPLDVKRRLITVHNMSHQDRDHSYVLNLLSYPIFSVKAIRQKTVECISQCVSLVSKIHYSLCRIRFLSNFFLVHSYSKNRVKLTFLIISTYCLEYQHPINMPWFFENLSE